MASLFSPRVPSESLVVTCGSSLRWLLFLCVRLSLTFFLLFFSPGNVFSVFSVDRPAKETDKISEAVLYEEFSVPRLHNGITSPTRRYSGR